MTEAFDTIKLERLVSRIDPQGELLRTWQLTGGASAQMTALEMLLSDGQTKRMILRQPGDNTLSRNPNAAADEFRLLQTMHSIGLPTPMPYYLDQSGEIFSAPCLIIEYVEGTPQFAPANLPDFIQQTAAALSKIHRINRSTLDMVPLPEQTQSVAAILEGRLANAANSSDDARIRAIFESARSLPQVNQATLLHGDYWPGNLLWKDDHLVAVIDWEDAHVGDPLADFAISRLDTLLIFGIAAMQDFTQQYQSMTAIDFTHLPYWDLCAALRAAPHLAEWAVGYPLVGRPDITENILRKGYELFINQAFEKIGAYT